MTQRFFLVDVFAQAPYSGNPLPVIVDESGLDDDVMQRIAAELNYSETAFVDPAPATDGCYRIKLYTPAREIAFAGHPLLGAARVIRDHVAGAGVPSIRLRLLQDSVDVTFEQAPDGGEVVWFRAPEVWPGATLQPADIAPAVGLCAEDVATETPVQVFSAGTGAILVPLRNRRALDHCRLDLEAFAPLASAGFPPLVYLFCEASAEAPEDFRVRFFFEAHGVREDAATGNGAAFLAAYLAANGGLPEPSRTLHIRQGDRIGRPSQVMLRIARAVAGLDIRVGGRVMPIIEGHLV